MDLGSETTNLKFDLDGYSLICKLGEGIYGVAELWSNEKDKVVLKRIYDTYASVESEMKALLRVRGHENISEYLGYAFLYGRWCLVFKYFSITNMCDFMSEPDAKPFSENDAKILFKQLLDGIKWCHEKGVYHIDIKLDNIVFNLCTMKLQLIDFGMAQFSEKTDRRLGSLEYVAPEVIGDTGVLDCEKLDIWSLGTVLYAWVKGRFPFHLNQKEAAAKYGYPIMYADYEDLSDQCRNLLENIFIVDPDKRYTLKNVLEHPWVVEGAQTVI